MVKNENCGDKNCPIHGSIKLRGRVFKGVIVSAKTKKSAIVEWARVKKNKKYERYEKRRTKIQVHNPLCMNAKQGDHVEIKECRPLSKTKKFVITGFVEEKKKITEKEAQNIENNNKK